MTIALSTSLLAGTRNPSVADEKYIEYGSKFTSVLNICGLYNDGSMFCASAVAINPEWILTAAHVVKNSKHCGIHIDGHKVIICDEVIIHKDFESSFGVADIALCKLKENLELDFYPKLYEENNELGKVCSISGYGSSGTFETGLTFNDGKRRAGSNIVDSIVKDLLICTPSKNVTDKITSLEFIIGSGDSGGGLFIDGKLAGINSCTISSKRSPKSVYGDESGHTRINKYIPWILENIKK